MKAEGIRILDKVNGVVTINLQDILQEIRKGSLFHWSILYFEGRGHLGEGKSIPLFESQVVDSETGFFITWNGLIDLAKKLEDIHHIIIIGCYDEKILVRYHSDQEMYENCDIVIEMFDSSFWEVFSKDHDQWCQLKNFQ